MLYCKKHWQLLKNPAPNSENFEPVILRHGFHKLAQIRNQHSSNLKTPVTTNNQHPITKKKDVLHKAKHPFNKLIDNSYIIYILMLIKSEVCISIHSVLMSV